MPMSVYRGILAFLLGFTLVLGVMGTYGHGATTLLPNGTQCFQQASGPLSSGSINMFIPSTTTPKNTWKDANQSVLNTNPIQLDANGCAVIYGVGSYRQQVYTGPVVSSAVSGTLLYDVLTADTSSFNSVFWAGTAGGTANAITLTDAGFNSTDGSVINFLALHQNTTSTTITILTSGAIPLKTPSPSGPIALTSGCIAANNPISVVYSSSAAAFLLLTPCQLTGVTAATAVPAPQGYLTLSSSTDSPVITADVTGSTLVYYTQYTGNQIPIWNGTSYSIFTFGQLTLTLSASNVGNTLYDVCVFSNSGVPAIVTGPAWSSSGAGTGARGTGAGTPQLQRVNGFWVNAVQITGANGVSTFTIPANQCTYVGTIQIDQTAGQISSYLSWGQNRKWGVFNAYNRLPIQVQAGDPTASWSFSGPGWRFSNATSGNAVTILTGLPEQQVSCTFVQSVVKASPDTNDTKINNGIAVNVGTITPTGKTGFSETNGASNTATGDDATAINYATSPLGITVFNTVENANGRSSTFFGTASSMVLQCTYRG